MASVNLSTISTEHGWLQPGWTQEEAASPHVIGDTTGETRQTSFSAIAKADSDLMVGKTLGAAGPFDSTGIMLETTLTGDTVSTSSYDVDSSFLQVRDFPTVASGYAEDVLDLFQRMYGQASVTVPWKPTGNVHAYYPLRGYRQGFTLDGQNKLYVQGSWDDTNFSGFNDYSVLHGTHAMEETAGFYRQNDTSIARQLRPLWASVQTGTNVNWASYRVRLIPGATISTRIGISTGFGLTPDTILECMIARTTGTAGTIGIEGQYAVAGAGSATTVSTTTVPTTGLDMSKDIMFVLQWGFLTTSQPGATLRVKIYAFDPDFPPAGAPTVVLSTDFPNVQRDRILANSFIYRKAGAGTYGFRDLILSQTDSSWPVHYPVIPEPTLISSTFTRTNVGVTPPTNAWGFNGAVPAWSGSGWDYLKMLTSARGLSMRVSGNQMVVGDLFPIGTIQPLSDAINEPVLRISAQDRARSVDVIANKSVGKWNFTGGAAPSLQLDVNATLRFGEDTTARVSIPPDFDLTNARLYALVTDADGGIVVWYDFWQAGARMIPSLISDGTVHLEFHGPRRNYPGIGNGPWQVESIRLDYTGALQTPERITLYTGAPDSMVTREKSGDVNNPFLNSTADVFDRSTWLISSVGSPSVSLNFSVSAAMRDRYQVGQVISYGWGLYRVMQVTHSKETSDISCEWFAPQAQQSANWAGLTANQWNTYWSGKRGYDTYLRPLASPNPVVNPAPFIRIYPSESENPVQPVVTLPAGSLFGTGLFGTGIYGS